ncbi:MAG: nucleoside 2-deoxyribosyltransferase [Bacteroidota bacterium]
MKKFIQERELYTRIYFCGSIRGGRQLEAVYRTLIQMLQDYGEVLTEHVGEPGKESALDRHLTDRQIHDRDLKWIMKSDVVVAEVTIPSLGVGYEIGRAIELEKPVLCLFDSSYGNKLSAMIAGSERVSLKEYSTPDDLAGVLKQFISAHVPRRTS